MCSINMGTLHIDLVLDGPHIVHVVVVVDDAFEQIVYSLKLCLPQHPPVK